MSPVRHYDDNDEPPSIAERYGMATQSSDLKVIERRCGDADYLIAAGWLKNRLGALLYRLRTEYDSARADLRRDDANLPDFDELEAEVEKKRAPLVVRRALIGRQLAEYQRLTGELLRIQQEKRTYRSTTRVLALLHLKTLASTRDAIWALASSLLAPNGPIPLSDSQARAITGRVIDAWLDPLCGSCDGRGFNGGQHRGEQKVTCRECGGHGLRRHSIGGDGLERQFARKLTAEITDAFTSADRAMRALMHNRP